MPNGNNGPSVHTSDGVKLKEWIETLFEGEVKLRNAQYQFLLDKLEQNNVQRWALAAGITFASAIVAVVVLVMRIFGL